MRAKAQNLRVNGAHSTRRHVYEDIIFEKLSELKDLDLAEVRTAPPVITLKTETPELD